MNNGDQKKIKGENLGKKGGGKGLLALSCCTIFLFFLLIKNADSFTASSEEETQFLLLSGKHLFLEKKEQQVTSGESTFKLSRQNHAVAPFFFCPIAINHCDKILLMSIKGIGPGLAESILKTREEVGGFSVPEDLLAVSGIGAIRLQKFTPYFSFLK